MKTAAKLPSLLCFLMLFLCLFLCNCNRTKTDWDKAQQINTIEAYQQFLSSHPDSRYATDAKAMLDQKTFRRDAELVVSICVLPVFEGEDHIGSFHEGYVQLQLAGSKDSIDQLLDRASKSEALSARLQQQLRKAGLPLRETRAVMYIPDPSKLDLRYYRGEKRVQIKFGQNFDSPFRFADKNLQPMELQELRLIKFRKGTVTVERGEIIFSEGIEAGWDGKVYVYRNKGWAISE
jgi:hypothetical protein